MVRLGVCLIERVFFLGARVVWRCGCLQESLCAYPDPDDPHNVTEITVTFPHSLDAEACLVVGG